jgi:2-methylcitrate dehydratase
MDETTSRLVDCAMAAEFSQLPDAVVHECKRRVVDTLACVAGAYDAELSQAARRLAGRSGGSPSATVLGSGQQTTAEMAAFANGVMLRYLDISDMFRAKSGGHPSDVIAAVLAAAEAAGADGRSFINAVTLSYDVYCSFCETIDVRSKGWDQPVFGVIAAAVGVGKLFGLERKQMADAIALALVPNMALNQTRYAELSSWKNCAGANASRNAVFAAILAREGFSGPSAPFEGRSGLWDCVGRFDWRMSADRGADAGVAKTHLKCFPACYHGQSAIWAALDLRARVNSADVRGLRVETYKRAVDAMASDATRWTPKTHETADHSLPYVVGVALLDGEVTIESFAQARLADPAVKVLMDVTEVQEVADLSARYPAAAPCRITARLKNGGAVTADVTYPKGHNLNPLSDQDLMAKFYSLFRGYGDRAQAEKVLETAWNLDRLVDLRPLFENFAHR